MTGQIKHEMTIIAEIKLYKINGGQREMSCDIENNVKYVFIESQRMFIVSCLLYGQEPD